MEQNEQQVQSEAVNFRQWLRERRLRRRRQLRRRQRHLAVLLVLGILLLGSVYFAFSLSTRDGWHNSAEGRYYLKDKARATGMRYIGDTLYLFDGDGYVLEGPAAINGSVYYSTTEGIRKGIVKINGEDYYFSEKDGILRRGFYTEGGVLYYRNTHGFTESGIREINGRVYQLDEDGRVITGWLSCESGDRYFRRKTTP